LPAPVTQKIEELNHQLAALKKELDQLNNEASNWAQKRNAIHEQIESLREEAKNLKEKRNSTNQKVQELKSLREKTKTDQKEKCAQLSKTEEKMRVLIEKKPPRHLCNIQKDIETIDWKIQTTPLSVKEEKVLVDQVRTLEKQRVIQKRLQELRDTKMIIQTEERTLAIRTKLSHEKLAELAEQSQKFHEQMVDRLNKAQNLKAEADTAHQKYMGLRQKANESHQKYVEVLQQIKFIKQEIQKKDKEQQAKRQQELRKEVTQKAQEKMSRGEKLTWDEFKLLTEQEPKTES
jgi:uncharacterized coiled-coil DUF342 family protein